MLVCDLMRDALRTPECCILQISGRVWQKYSMMVSNCPSKYHKHEWYAGSHHHLSKSNTFLYIRQQDHWKVYLFYFYKKEDTATLWFRHDTKDVHCSWCCASKSPRSHANTYVLTKYCSNFTKRKIFTHQLWLDKLIKFGSSCLWSMVLIPYILQ